MQKCDIISDCENTLCAIFLENLDSKTAYLDTFSWNNFSIFSSSPNQNFFLSKKSPIIIYCDIRDLPDVINLSLLNYIISLKYDKFSARYTLNIKKINFLNNFFKNLKT